MARQHAAPVLLGADGSRGVSLTQLSLAGGASAVSEAEIQRMIHDHPECLPIPEIDSLFANPIPLCMELNTPAGPIDNFLVTASGLPVLVECKLWRNPEGRREVVGQILDYAKELGRWSSSDLQREVARRLGPNGATMLELIRAAGHEVDEIDFNDALTRNLRSGRFLLLIVGDGIREGVEAIAEYLQRHANLHFTLGLVEMPLFQLPDRSIIAVPRVLAKTLLLSRQVVAVPEGMTLVSDDGAVEGAPAADPQLEERQRFFRELLEGFEFSDPDQPAPKPTPKGYLFLYMPAPSSSCWINVSVKEDQVGIWIVGNKNTLGDRAIKVVTERWEEVRPLLGGAPELKHYGNDRVWIAEYLHVAPFADAEQRKTAIEWLRRRMDEWVSVFRPRIRSAVADLEDEKR